MVHLILNYKQAERMVFWLWQDLWAEDAAAEVLAAVVALVVAALAAAREAEVLAVDFTEAHTDRIFTAALALVFTATVTVADVLAACWAR